MVSDAVMMNRRVSNTTEKKTITPNDRVLVDQRDNVHN
jgi:hypothetical protein